MSGYDLSVDRPVPRSRPLSGKQPVRIQDRSRLIRPQPAPVVRHVVTRYHNDDLLLPTVRTVLNKPRQPAPAGTQPLPLPVGVTITPPFTGPSPPQQQSLPVLRHQFGDKSAPRSRSFPMMRHTLLHGRSRLQLILIGLALLVFGLGLLVDIETLQTNHDAKAQVAALTRQSDSTTTGSPTVPAQTKPSSSAVKSYQVAPNLPKYLKIPKLGIDARVLQTGVTSSGALGTPPNIYDTAWYTGSAHPGDSGSLGAILIDGHVHGPTLPGVFMDIKNLKPGDGIQIVRGDNQVFTYQVVKVQNYDASTMNMGMMLASIQPGEPGLNLITCGGPFDRTTGEYSQRTAVFAVQM
jgi:sortase (surface protein transpeptidase)